MRMERLKGRDFLRIADWGGEELLAVLDLADRLKDERKRYVDEPLLPGRSVGLFLEKPSLRTRVSFELAVEQLGAHAVYLTGPEIGLGTREAPRDIAYVLSRYLDAIVIRTFGQAIVEEIAEHAYIPVVNGLTDDTHPCQALADAMTIRERLGGFDGVRVAWLGDGNNVCASLMVACAKLGMVFAAATPPGYEPSSDAIEAAQAAGGYPSLLSDPREAASGANVLCTDVWTSMGQEDERERRQHDLASYRIDADMLAAAAPGAIVLHCLPAHIGEEITEDVIYGPSCAAWDQAENRLHSEKALLALIVP
jgi:ornithine carbamoyltransferase